MDQSVRVWPPHMQGLLELLVVLAIIGSLLTIVAPRFFQQIDRGKEAVLRENLYALRSSIDRYYSDKGSYPPSLESLGQERYLRQVPRDPATDRTDTWSITIRRRPARRPGIGTTNKKTSR